MGGKPRPLRVDVSLARDQVATVERQLIATFHGHPVYADSLRSEPVWFVPGYGWTDEKPA